MDSKKYEIEFTDFISHMYYGKRNYLDNGD